LVSSIVSIEFTLNLNHVNNVIGASGIGGAGQMIPLFIGMISLLKVLYELAREHAPCMRKREKIEHHTSKNSKLGVDDAAYSSVLQNASTHDLHEQADHGLQAVSTLPLTGLQPSSTGLLHPRTPAQQLRSLPHRALLAWLPWLHIFSWSRKSLTPESFRDCALFHYHRRTGTSTKGKQRDLTDGFERLGLGSGGRGTRDTDPTNAGFGISGTAYLRAQGTIAPESVADSASDRDGNASHENLSALLIASRFSYPPSHGSDAEDGSGRIVPVTVHEPDDPVEMDDLDRSRRESQGGKL
jgi:hypothetical protein